MVGARTGSFKKKPVEFGEFHQKSPGSGQSEFSKGDKN
jgi:hypothetical protein